MADEEVVKKKRKKKRRKRRRNIDKVTGKRKYRKRKVKIDPETGKQIRKKYKKRRCRVDPETGKRIYKKRKKTKKVKKLKPIDPVTGKPIRKKYKRIHLGTGRFGIRRDRSAIIESIFDKDAKDLKYIIEDEELLKQHIQFITESRFTKNTELSNLVVPEGKAAGKSPKIFLRFDEYYPAIYSRWIHIIRSCLDPTYVTYQFFGARGVYVSRQFLDSKFFCRWCLTNGLVSKSGSYDMYLLRRKKTGNYSPINCYVAKEKDIHECKSVKQALDNLYIVKRYEESHHPSVSYMTMYTRYYVWDWPLDDALSVEYTSSRCLMDKFGFSPLNFYISVADENSCTQSVFLSRVHYSYLNGGFTCRPYDMLKPDYSVSEECFKQGKLSYKQQYERDRKEKENKYNPYTDVNKLNIIKNLNNIEDDVYSYNKDFDVYSD